ncbi:VanZ family protein [Microbacterium sp. cx-55]|uniref:VanZ family protein n=1 Tax=unclassified Microbacterium TaxID=2609290 RepID=UPI001CBF2AAA|nr:MULTISPECIES: VanZ family protein [unclassified Microbacterium]MBZ4487810.1 VanZ family protein [Microbacterium sp. cx-55]MCC4909164.1 VanZ family protein [Microbacterium sp. cx-59]UGB34778.1 VanZ family protein [Microbacterium sp. cx-55]
MQQRTTAERRARVRAAVLLIAYLVAAALVAFWPVPVDSGATGFLHRVEQILPWATYRRIEFGANIVFFVPFGWLLSILLDRSRHLVLPIGIVTTVAIEAIQGELLSQRTASIYDVLANTTGTCVGMLLAAIWARRTPVRPVWQDPGTDPSRA